MLTLLIAVNSAEATTDTQILLDDKLSVEGFSFSIDADEADSDGGNDLNFLEQTQLDSNKRIPIYVSLFASKKALARLHPTPPIRAPPNFYS